MHFAEDVVLSARLRSPGVGRLAIFPTTRPNRRIMRIASPRVLLLASLPLVLLGRDSAVAGPQTVSTRCACKAEPGDPVMRPGSFFENLGLFKSGVTCSDRVVDFSTGTTSGCTSEGGCQFLYFMDITTIPCESEFVTDFVVVPCDQSTTEFIPSSCASGALVGSIELTCKKCASVGASPQ